VIAGQLAGQVGVEDQVGQDARIAESMVPDEETAAAHDLSQPPGEEEILAPGQVGAIGR
jgi:hypothetical protein